MRMELFGYLIIGAFEILGVNYLSKYYLQPKRMTKILSILIYAAYITITAVQAHIIYNIYLNTVVDFIMYMVLIYCYKGSLYKKLLICSVSEITFILSESIVLISSQILTGVKFVNNSLLGKYMPLLCCITDIIGLLLIWLIIRLTTVYQKHRGHWFAGNIFLIFTLVLLSVDLIVNFGKTQYLFHSLFIIFLLIIAVTICLDMYERYNKSEPEKRKTLMKD